MSRPIRRTIVTVLVAVLAALVLAGCLTEDQQADVTLINQARRANAKAALKVSTAAASKAQKWSDHMARTGVLEHTGGGSAVDPSGVTGWCSYAENVGKAGSLSAVHDLFLRSAPHRANMLGNYQLVGTGVTVRRGAYWVTEIYLRSC